MAVIPSRLAGIPEALEYWMNRNRGNASEQRAAERHQAWRRNLAAVKAQAAQQAQMQRGALQKFQGDMANQMLRMSGTPGVTMLPQQVINPKHADEMRTWDLEMEEGEDPPVSPMPLEIINQERAMTPQDKYQAWQLYNRAHGTNMPGASAFAKALGAGVDAQDPFVEKRWNAAMSEGGIPFGSKQREGYRTAAQDAIGSAMAEAQAAKDGGLAGTFGDAQQDNIDDVRRVIMQDAWTVARKIARDSNLIDEGTAFDQILDAMARGKISAMQISQLSGEDAIVGDEGISAYWTPNTRGLQAGPTSREQLREEFAKEYGSQYGRDRTSAQGVGPIIRN
jgi:hypothetical protein